MYIYGLPKLGLIGNIALISVSGSLSKQIFLEQCRLLVEFTGKFMSPEISYPHIPFIDLQEIEGKGFSNNSKMRWAT